MYILIIVIIYIFIKYILSTGSYSCPDCGKKLNELNFGKEYYICEGCGVIFRKIGENLYIINKIEGTVSEIIDNMCKILAFIAKADEIVTQREEDIFLNFLEGLDLSPEQRKWCGRTFNEYKAMEYNTHRVKETLKDLVSNFTKLNSDAVLELKEDILFVSIIMAEVDGEMSFNQSEIINDMISYLKIPIIMYDRVKKKLSKDFEYSDSRESCYELLGIKKGCSIKELKSAYRKMMNIYHPDKLNSVDLDTMIKEDLLKKAKEIQHAYECIKEWEGLS